MYLLLGLVAVAHSAAAAVHAITTGRHGNTSKPDMRHEQLKQFHRETMKDNERNVVVCGLFIRPTD